MKIYNVGPDEISESEILEEFPDAVWVVYWYEYECYEGGGDMVVFMKDGRLASANLGHCSCFGPMEGGWCSEPLDRCCFDPADLTSPDLHTHDIENKEVIDKAVSLLRQDGLLPEED